MEPQPLMNQEMYPIREEIERVFVPAEPTIWERMKARVREALGRLRKRE